MGLVFGLGHRAPSIARVDAHDPQGGRGPRRRLATRRRYRLQLLVSARHGVHPAGTTRAWFRCLGRHATQPTSRGKPACVLRRSAGGLGRGVQALFHMCSQGRRRWWPLSGRLRQTPGSMRDPSRVRTVLRLTGSATAHVGRVGICRARHRRTNVSIGQQMANK